MDPTNMTMTQQVIFGAALGLLLGLVPLIAGIIRGRLKLGLIGFVASIAGGSVFALLLAFPISVLFTWLVLRKPRLAVDSAPD